MCSWSNVTSVSAITSGQSEWPNPSDIEDLDIEDATDEHFTLNESEDDEIDIYI